MTNAPNRTVELVDEYYTLCIPYYQEFLGNHWHTGFYAFDDQPIGLPDQLRMECRIADSAGITPESHVLEVGCGVGGPACHLAQRTGARFWGVTPNAAQLLLARQLAEVTGVAERVTFDHGTASELPYPDASFDVVLFFESPCHFPDRHKFFREVARVLRSAGRLAGEDWLAATDLSPWATTKYLDPICETWAIPRLGTQQEYADAMEAAGLVVREAVDLREEMALLRGFLVNEADRMDVLQEIEQTADPMRRMILNGLLVLGEAAAVGAFTLGRFLADR